MALHQCYHLVVKHDSDPLTVWQDFHASQCSSAVMDWTTHQHLAGSGFLLQAGRLDAKTLLVSQVDKLPAVILRYVLHVLGYKTDTVKYFSFIINANCVCIVKGKCS